MSNSSVTLLPNVDGQSIAYGIIPWIDPQYAGDEDSKYAYATFAGSDVSEWLLIYQFLQMPAINTHMTITGVELVVGGYSDVDDVVRITEAQITTTAAGTQVIGSSTLDSSKPFITSYKYYSVGADGEMWGLSQSAMKTFLNSKFLGFQFSMTEETGTPAVAYVDTMYMIVYYDRRARVKCALGAGL